MELDNRDAGVNRIRQALEKAQADANSLPEYKESDTHRLAIAFIGFFGESNASAKAVRDTWISEVQEISHKHDAAVASFFLLETLPTCPSAAVIVKRIVS